MNKDPRDTESKSPGAVTESAITDMIQQAGDSVKKGYDDLKDDLSKDPYGTIEKLNDKQLAGAATSAREIDDTMKRHQVNTKSIVARARDSVLQFPVYITQTNPVAAAHTISKLFERVYTTLVQTVLSQNQIIDEAQANDLVFLKQFHTNLKESADRFARASAPMLFNEFYEPIDDMDAMLMESVYHTEQISEGCSVSFRLIPTTNPDLIAESARLINEPLTGIAYLREAADDRSRKQKRADAKNASLYYTDREKETEKDASGKKNPESTTVKYVTVSDKELQELALEQPNNHLSDACKKALDDPENADPKLLTDAQKQIELDVKMLKERIRKGEIDDYSMDAAGRIRRKDKQVTATSRTKIKEKTIQKRETPVDKAVEAPKMLRDADIKKINGMLPYTIEATFRLRTKQGLDRDVKYVIGIKTVLHLVRTQDLADDLQDLVTGKIRSLQKVRYKTGELTFMDYMFNIKGLKADAAKHINYNKRWVNTLKRLADYGDMNGSLMKKPVQALANGSVPIPNGTLVLAQTDVTTLTNQTGIDLSNVSNAKRLAKNLFLIAIAIVDASAGTMRVLLPDSQNDWDVQSLASVDAELAKTENSQLMKELQSAINKR